MLTAILFVATTGCLDPGDLRDLVTGADWYEDEDCAAYGLTSRQTEELKAWALG